MIIRLPFSEKSVLSKQIAYVSLDEVENYIYIDNKKNTYTKSYYNIDYQDFKNSDFTNVLENDYSKTRWFLEKDTLFISGQTEV